MFAHDYRRLHFQSVYHIKMTLLLESRVPAKSLVSSVLSLFVPGCGRSLQYGQLYQVCEFYCWDSNAPQSKQSAFLAINQQRYACLFGTCLIHPPVPKAALPLLRTPHLCRIPIRQILSRIWGLNSHWIPEQTPYTVNLSFDATSRRKTTVHDDRLPATDLEEHRYVIGLMNYSQTRLVSWFTLSAFYFHYRAALVC